MSRLRRLFQSGKTFFVTCNVFRTRRSLSEEEFQILALALDRVRKRRGFLLNGFVFMPDHWHALIYPAPGDTLPRLIGALKIASSRALNKARRTEGEFWQLRYFDHAVRTVRECRDALQYIHLNPVKKGLAEKPEDWAWSSFRAYAGQGPVGVHVDLLDLPAEETTRL
jgi:putative transposase